MKASELQLFVAPTVLAFICGTTLNRVTRLNTLEMASQIFRQLVIAATEAAKSHSLRQEENSSKQPMFPYAGTLTNSYTSPID